ncbi:MAG TPA: PHB depolymerase family esterase [Acetobacteraceae bacterium]|nr:PHB depolymerase family esterase [Acetobacteraceae bacterium]
MTNVLNADLLEATRLTKAGKLTEALHLILGTSRAASGAAPATTGRTPRTIEGVAEPAGTARAQSVPQPGPAVPGASSLPFNRAAKLGSAPPGLLDRMTQGGLHMSGGRRGGPASLAGRVSVPDGAQFLTASFCNDAGSRPYKLYVPSGYRPGVAVPLIVMLHGCTQTPDDFAAGTRMNEAAEEHTCLVVYPGQTAAANMQKCWNWFSEGDQHRGQGEPALIAGITHQVMRDFAVDPRRVYVAGLSAGGAAAAIMGDAYPDVFAAIGVHSGLACGAARDIPSAFAAMQGSGPAAAGRPGGGRPSVPAIVFHGDRDGTVNPRNADAVVAQSAQAAALTTHAEQVRAAGGRTYSRTLSIDLAGQTVIEQWVVHGAGHAWFGGSAAGTYTDPRGPDATREMVRFFLEHPHPEPMQTV